jgi:tripartite-type tricarboxylate transporter receptor subunit TctC
MLPLARRCLGLALAALAFAASPALAFPERPVRLVVPYAPGGGTDVVARVIAEALGAQFAPHAVLVENRAGAGGLVGAEYVARSAPDGHTLLFTNTGHSVLRALVPNHPIDVHQALTPVTIVAESPMVMMVANNVPARDGREFLALLRANPGRYDYGSTGGGGTNGMTALMFLKAADVRMNEVPYRGGAPATLDLAAGRIAMLFDAGSTALPTTRGGQARAFAVTTRQRSPSAPEVPTLRELGVEADMSIWMAIMAPSATPPATREALQAAVARALQSEAVRARLAEFGTDRVLATPPAESERYVAAEITRWEALLRERPPQQ